MSTISLTYHVTKTPDFGGFRFYVEAGQLFDADDYAEVYKLRRYDIDPDNIKAVQDACGHLNPGEWLRVEHHQDDTGANDEHDQSLKN